AEFAVTVTEEARGTVLHLAGEARCTATDRLRLTLTRLIARRVPLIVLDLTGLTLLDSLPTGAMGLFCRHTRRFGGRVKIAGIRPQVYASLEAVGLDEFFEFCGTVEEALATT